MRNGTARTPSLGASHAGVRFTDSRRINSELVRLHRVSGYENAPIEPMDDEFSGKHRVLSWGACLAAGAIMWTGFFAWVFA